MEAYGVRENNVPERETIVFFVLKEPNTWFLTSEVRAWMKDFNIQYQTRLFGNKIIVQLNTLVTPMKKKQYIKDNKLKNYTILNINEDLKVKNYTMLLDIYSI